jgi:P27 family predicted phage terminase small subunit
VSQGANIHYLSQDLDGDVGDVPDTAAAERLVVDVDIPGCPAFLLAGARKEWRRITPELKRYGLISKIDRAALALYCQCWARWEWAEQQLTAAQAKAAAGMAAAAAEGREWTGGDGVTVATPNGHMTYSPHWVIANKAMEQVNTYLKNFGMSPMSRKQVQLGAQRDMFDDDADARPHAPTGGHSAI